VCHRQVQQMGINLSTCAFLCDVYNIDKTFSYTVSIYSYAVIIINISDSLLDYFSTP